MSAPNPWFQDSPELELSGILDEGEHPLEMIREFILNWPGEETVKLGPLVRHNRLVQIIAGYPEIDVGRYPLDWPLSKKAAKALRLTQYLDTIHSPDAEKSTSLRSVLLNKSYKMKNLNGEKFAAAHRRLIAILLLALRDTSDKNLKYGLSSSEHKLLLSLHSNSQNRMKNFWPLKEVKGVVSDNWSRWDSENYLPKITKSSMSPNFCEGWVNFDDILTEITGDRISVKLNKIQDWINNWSDRHEKWGKRNSTFIRGSSAILESVMSSLRNNIIANHGVESILVDGGGRIEFIGDHDAAVNLNEAFINVFSLNENRVPYFNNEIMSIARILSGKTNSEKIDGSDFGLIYGISVNEWKDINLRRIKISEWINRHLPPLSITVNGSQPEEIKFQQIVNPNCCICDEHIEVQGSVQDRIGQIFDKDKPYCTFHRLLYNIGDAQRMIDSTTKEFGKTFQFTYQPQRQVNGVARLDLNSLGILFTNQRNVNQENSLDIRRRRSIRFNSQWWNIVNEILDDDKLDIDQIVAWVAAGDDLILADYIPAGNPSTSKLSKILKNLSSKLHKLSSKEYYPFGLSFGAGLTKKEEVNNIVEMMGCSKDAEDVAKNYWKKKTFDEQNQWMITDNNGLIKNYQTEEIDEHGVWPLDDCGSIVYEFQGREAWSTYQARQKECNYLQTPRRSNNT